jgi:hypothetical protein
VKRGEYEEGGSMRRGRRAGVSELGTGFAGLIGFVLV